MTIAAFSFALIDKITQMQSFKPEQIVKIQEITSTYKNISVLKVVSPIRPNSSLAANVPHVQLETGRLHTFDVETLTNILCSINLMMVKKHRRQLL